MMIKNLLKCKYRKSVVHIPQTTNAPNHYSCHRIAVELHIFIDENPFEIVCDRVHTRYSSILPINSTDNNNFDWIYFTFWLLPITITTNHIHITTCLSIIHLFIYLFYLGYDFVVIVCFVYQSRYHQNGFHTHISIGIKRFEF